MFLSLLLASSLHYYAVFALFPFLLAEMLVFYQTREIRLKVWLALLAALVPLWICLPLLIQLKQRFGAHPYSRAWPHAFGTTYNGFFGLDSAWGTALAGAASVAMLASYFSMAPQPGDAKSSPAAYASERVLVLGLILLPVAGYAAAKITHAPFWDRYFLPAILGIIAAVGYVLGRSKRMGIMLTGTFVLFAIGTQERGFWKSVHHQVAPAERVSPLTSLAEVVQHQDLPIVISDLPVYMEFWHYAPPGLRQRIVALVDPTNAVTYIGTDSADQVLLALRSFAPVAAQDFASFAVEHPVFLLYSNGSQFDWWPERLSHDGHRLQLLAGRGREAMYLVELKGLPPN
jgi:hypothetical protein